MTERRYTTQEFADRLGVSPATLRNYNSDPGSAPDDFPPILPKDPRHRGGPNEYDADVADAYAEARAERIAAATAAALRRRDRSAARRAARQTGSSLGNTAG